MVDVIYLILICSYKDVSIFLILLFVLGEGGCYAIDAVLDIISWIKFDPSEELLEDFANARFFFQKEAAVGRKYLFVFSQRKFIVLDKCTKIDIDYTKGVIHFAFSAEKTLLHLNINAHLDSKVKEYFKSDYPSFEKALINANPQLESILKDVRSKLKNTYHLIK